MLINKTIKCFSALSGKIIELQINSNDRYSDVLIMNKNLEAEFIRISKTYYESEWDEWIKFQN